MAAATRYTCRSDTSPWEISQGGSPPVDNLEFDVDALRSAPSLKQAKALLDEFGW
jgi:hypothetical protein